jgi:capsular exopolysaccharide synthesis family protein
MSKIFEALKYSEGEAAQAVFPALADAGGNVPMPAPAPAVEAPVTGEPVFPAPPSPAAVLPSPAAGLPSAAVLEDPAAARPAPAPAVSAPPAGSQTAGEYRVLRLQVREFSPVLPFDDTNLRASEQYRIIRTRIIQHPSQPRMLVVSSPGPADGKSLSAINIAGALSLKTSAKVLLVDADFRRASIHIQCGFRETPGLADVLGLRCPLQEAVIRCEQFPSLYVLPAGGRPANPAELLDSPQWAQLCAGLRQEFGYIIVDSPPMEAVADYALIQAACDGVIVVVRPDHTNRKACFELIDKVPKAKFVGVLLNCVSEWFLARPYTYDSYYYRRPE